MIDVPVVQYIVLTGVVSTWSQMVTLVHTVNRTWTRCYYAGTGLQLVLVAWSRRIEQVG